MNILLTAINAKYIHSNLAVYSLRAYASQYKEHIQLAEFTINHRVDFILEEIYKKKPDVLIFSCYIWNIEYIKELIREFSKLCPDVPVWVGGPEVSFETETFLRENPAVTGIMVGEGEATFAELCGYYADQICDSKQEKQICGKFGLSGLRDIKGLVFREEEKILHTEPREPLDLSTIPFCYDTLDEFEHRIIYYESGRGCPFSCSYCLSSVDKKLRFRDLALVFAELQFFLDHKVQQVKFVDRTFNCNHAHAMAIWQFITEHDNGVTNFHFEVSADLFRDEELELIRSMRPGLIQLEIGVQSTNPQTIREIHRTMDLEKLKEKVRYVQDGKNVHQHLDLIAGLPFEDYDTFRRSFNEIYAWKPEELQLGFLKVLKGSFMYEHSTGYGVLYRDKPPYEVLSTKWLSFEDILNIRLVEEMLEVYYNSNQYMVSIQLLEQQFDSAFDMFLQLGRYYEDHRLLNMSHSRMRRCEILLEFVEQTCPKSRGLIGEALVFDLYAREKMKSRPFFAADLSIWKKQMRSFLKETGREQTYCHLEYFSKDFSECGIRDIQKMRSEPVWILFDYEKRNPLTRQADISILKKGLESLERISYNNS